MTFARSVTLGIAASALVAAGFGSSRVVCAQQTAMPDAGRTAPRVIDAGRRDSAQDGSRDGDIDSGADVDARASLPIRTHCPEGMRLVDGEYCPTVEQECLRWLDPDEEIPMRCAEFAPTRCVSRRRRHVNVCMDEYEYPNRAGAYPQVMVSWYAARRACEARGARLCTMSEWTFACEGEQMLPYPYGQQRDDTACHFDHQRLRPDRARLANPATSADESARLYDAVPSGQYSRCVSPFGIHDMTGNADEWTVNETGEPFQSALKGGWWGPIRARCRPATISHNEGFVYYQIGFRCCADPT
jgi:hypothetical protein